MSSDPDLDSYLAASHHHYYCDVCKDGHDDRGREPGSCISDEDRMRDALTLFVDAFEEPRVALADLNDAYEAACVALDREAKAL